MPRAFLQSISRSRTLVCRSQCLSLANACSTGLERQGGESQFGPFVFDRPTNGVAFVATQVVHVDDVSGLERRSRSLLDLRQECFAVDWAGDDAGRDDPVADLTKTDNGNAISQSNTDGARSLASVLKILLAFVSTSAMKAFSSSRFSLNKFSTRSAVPFFRLALFWCSKRL